MPKKKAAKSKQPKSGPAKASQSGLGDAGPGDGDTLCALCGAKAARDLAAFGPAGVRFWRCPNLDCTALQPPHRWHILPTR